MAKDYMRKEVAIKTNLAFIVADMLESCIVDVKDAIEQYGGAMQYNQKRIWNNAESACRQLTKEISHLDEKTQMDFGNDADVLWCFLKLIMSRSGSDYIKMYRFFEYIKSYPEIIPMPHLDKEIDRAFSMILKNHKK